MPSHSTGSAPARRTRIGRIVTDPPTSMLLMLASGYFLLNGAFTLLLVLVALITGAAAEIGARPATLALGVAWTVAVAALQLWIGVLLGRRARLGGIGGAIVIAVPLVSAALGGAVTGTQLLLALLGVAVLASVWPELR